ncbi:MAG: putative bifunctional diguanylate cyclase/phosphodiesterase [Granulosicoccus sp.]
MRDSEHSTVERRADHELRQAVHNIQNRFLERVSDRVARGLSLRELSEELIVEALRLTDAVYGCVLRPVNPQKLTLDAVVSVSSDGKLSRQHDNLLESRPDEVIRDVIEVLKPTFSNSSDDIELSNLPSAHPRILSYAICPIHEHGSLKALLLVANVRHRFDLVLVKRLQSMLDAFIRVHINSIINRGINNIIAGVGDTNRQLLSLLEASFNAIVSVDDNLNVTAFNPASEQLFQVDTQSALGSSLDLFLSHDAIESIQKKAADYSYSLRANDERPYRLENSEAIKASSQRVPVELTVFHSRIRERVYTTLVLNDISGRLQSDAELQNALVQYRTLTKLAPVGILKLDDQWLCEYANDMWCRLSSLTVESNAGSGWIEGIHRDDQSLVLTDMQRCQEKGETYRDIVKLNSTGNSTIWASINATALVNNLGQFTGSLVVIMDITEQYEAEQRFKQIAHHDALTGLPNRTRFLEHLHNSLAQRSVHGIVCLLFIDLDGFKAINDTLGHDAGDALLLQVAQRLRHTVSDEDTVARLGGDEFTVTLRRLVQTKDASTVADAIVHSIKQPFLLEQEEVYVSASIGIAMATGLNSDTTSDANSLIKQADIALYRAKLSGRSRHVFFTPELDQAQRDRSVLITSLRRAVDRQDFELFYQPQLLIKENRVLGFEALLRWPQETGEHISPGAFIDVLEETGLIGELGEWAISQACGQHKIWLRRGLISPATTMSVNVSARQLSTPNFAQRITSILQRHSMRPDSLILEITESALVQTIETDIINEIKALGVQISLDDFGTGYSSLAYLSQLPLDHLKIDRSFIADIERFPHAVAVVKSIIALANTLGIRVIAEGVETPTVLPMLANEGCEGYQGFYFSEPLPARAMAARLESAETVTLSHYANFIDLGERLTV